jgi:hypothetical protein
VACFNLRSPAFFRGGIWEDRFKLHTHKASQYLFMYGSAKVVINDKYKLSDTKTEKTLAHSAR